MVNSRTNFIYVFLRRNIYWVFLFVVSAMVPFFWYHRGYLMTISDLYFPLLYDPVIYHRYFFSWLEKFAPGVESSRGLLQIPYQTFIYLFSMLHLSMQTIQHILFSFLIFMSVVFFSKTIFDLQPKFDKKLAFLISFFYVFNPYSLTVFWGTISLTIIPYLLLPVFQYYFNRVFVVRYEAFNINDLIKLGIVSLLMNSCGNPIFLFSVLLVDFVALSVWWLSGNYHKIVWKKILLFAVLLFLLNSFWVGNFVFSMLSEAQNIAQNNIGYENNPLGLVKAITFNATVSELLQLKGFWVLYGKYMGQPYYDYAGYYKDLGVAFYFFPLAFIFLFLTRQKRKPVAYLYLLIFLLSIFVIQGIHLYLGAAFYTVMLKSVLGIAFRNPMDKFGPLFVFSYLLCFSLLFASYTNHKIKRIIISILLVYLILCWYPLLSGKIFRKVPGKLQSYYVQVPDEYYQIRELLSEKKLLANLYTYPYLEQYFGTAYNWGETSFQGGHPSYYLFHTNTIGGGNKEAIKAFQAITRGEKEAAIDLLSHLGVRYVLFHDDFNWDYHKYHLEELKTNKSGAIDGFNKIFGEKGKLEKGKLTFYTIDNPYPYIYVQDDAAKVEFGRVNPTQYRVRLHHVKNDTISLVLSQTFNSGWRIYRSYFSAHPLGAADIRTYQVLPGNDEDQASPEELGDLINKGWVSYLGDDEKIDFISKARHGSVQNDNLSRGSVFKTWFEAPVAAGSHTIVNKYANQWDIDVDELCASNNCRINQDGSRDIELVVEYWPQRLFVFGSLISSFTLLVMAGYLLLKPFKHWIRS